MSKKKAKAKSYYKLAKSLRGCWNGVNPTTRVFRDRTKYTRKVKHPARFS